MQFGWAREWDEEKSRRIGILYRNPLLFATVHSRWMCTRYKLRANRTYSIFISWKIALDSGWERMGTWECKFNRKKLLFDCWDSCSHLPARNVISFAIIPSFGRSAAHFFRSPSHSLYHSSSCLPPLPDLFAVISVHSHSHQLINIVLLSHASTFISASLQPQWTAYK